MAAASASCPWPSTRTVSRRRASASSLTSSPITVREVLSPPATPPPRPRPRPRSPPSRGAKATGNDTSWATSPSRSYPTSGTAPPARPSRTLSQPHVTLKTQLWDLVAPKSGGKSGHPNLFCHTILDPILQLNPVSKFGSKIGWGDPIHPILHPILDPILLLNPSSVKTSTRARQRKSYYFRSTKVLPYFRKFRKYVYSCTRTRTTHVALRVFRRHLS